MVKSEQQNLTVEWLNLSRKSWGSKIAGQIENLANMNFRMTDIQTSYLGKIYAFLTLRIFISYHKQPSLSNPLEQSLNQNTVTVQITVMWD